MKKLLSVLVLLLLLLTACGHQEGIVTEKKETSFIVAEPSEEGDELEVHLTDLSVFSGSISSYEELKEGDHVRVIRLKTDKEFSFFLLSEAIVE